MPETSVSCGLTQTERTEVSELLHSIVVHAEAEAQIGLQGSIYAVIKRIDEMIDSAFQQGREY